MVHFADLVDLLDLVSDFADLLNSDTLLKVAVKIEKIRLIGPEGAGTLRGAKSLILKAFFEG